MTSTPSPPEFSTPARPRALLRCRPHRRAASGESLGPATGLLLATAAVLLGGCMANPHPKPLVVASPVSTALTVPTTTAAALSTAPPPEPAPTSRDTQAHAERPARRPSPRDVSRKLGSAGIPRSSVITQPSPRTRLGTDTILYTRPRSFAVTIRVDGVTIRVTAAPVSYTWRFGDGAVRTTTTPGAAYPHHTVTHVYRAAGVVHPSVTTGYRVRYRLPDGTWRTLRATYPVAGPTTSLTVVREP